MVMSRCSRRELVLLTWNRRRDKSCLLPMLLARCVFCYLLVAAVFFTFQLIVTFGTNLIII